MKAQDYSIAHFEFMSRIVGSLEALPAQLLNHEYSAEHFGSWAFSVRYKGEVASVSCDGRDFTLWIRYSTERKAPYDYGPEVQIVLDESDPIDSQATVRRIFEYIKAPPTGRSPGAA